MDHRQYAPFLLAAFTLGACGHKAASGSASTGTAIDTSANPTAPDAVLPDNIDTNTHAPAHPAAADVATNAAAQGQIAAGAMDSASSAAAAGGSGAGSGAGLTLADGGLDLANPAQPSGTTKIQSGSLSQDCYAGTASIHGPSRPNGLAWPESTDSASIFAGSKDDATTPATMAVEASLLMYPVSSTATPQLKLTTPFAFAASAEVIESDTRTTQIQLQDHAQTSYSATVKSEEHRFWVAKSAAAKAASAAIACVGTNDAAKGTSGKADGTWAKIEWADDAQVNGLNLLSRFARSGTQVQSYLRHHYDKALKAVVYDATPTVLNTVLGASGYRLVQWAADSAAATAPLADGSTVANAAVVRTKTVTHDVNQTHQRLDGSNNVISDTSNYDEVRAADPLVIAEYRDGSERPLLHLVQSGTIVKTGKDAQGNPKWFSTLAFKNVKYDLVNATEACIPVGGTVTMTTYDKEGGTQLKQVVITYASVAAAAGGGKVDPLITVAGDDGQSTQAQWIFLNVNHKCDLK